MITFRDRDERTATPGGCLPTTERDRGPGQGVSFPGVDFRPPLTDTLADLRRTGEGRVPTFVGSHHRSVSHLGIDEPPVRSGRMPELGAIRFL
jgi:hypothetical protein